MTEEDTDIALIALPLLGPEEGDYTLEPTSPVKDRGLETLWEILPGSVDGEALVLGEGPDPALFPEVPGFGPGIYRSVLNGAPGIGQNEIFVVLQRRPEPRALGAGSKALSRAARTVCVRSC